MRRALRGALLYALGLVVMAYATTPGVLQLGAGVLIGFGLSGCSFNLVLGAFGKLLPEKWRPMAFGAGTAAGSFGQFLFPPIGNILIEAFGWQQALVVFAASVLLVLPLALRSRRGRPRTPPAGGRVRSRASRSAGAGGGVPAPLLRAAGARLLHLRLPARLHHRAPAGLPQGCGPLGRRRRLDLAVIGLANAFGSLGSGWLTTRMSKRWLLAWIYFGRSLAIAVFIILPPSPVTSILFGISIGLLWLSTVPPTSSLVMLMFGTRYMAMLYGFAFFSHQVGGFLGVWLGGVSTRPTATTSSSGGSRSRSASPPP